MTREEFIAKIENPDDVERVMARVDEGIKLMNYTDATKIAEWYDFCAKRYDRSILPSTIEGVPDMVTGEEHGMIVKEFSFLHFNAFLSEAFDNYRSLMFSVEREDRITDEVGAAKMSLKRTVDAYVERPSNQYNDPSFVHKVHKVVAKYLGEYALAADTRGKDLADAIAILKIKEHMDIAAAHDHSIKYYIQSVSFKPNEGSSWTIKGENALKMMADVFVPYYCDRYLSKFDLKTLERQHRTWAALKDRTIHMTIYEIYKLFIEFYNEKFTYRLDEDLYNLGERNGKYPGLINEISVWIFDLMAEISDEFNKNKSRPEKVDYIRTRMQAKLYGLDKVDLPREWSLFLY
jgi:hypothetical protein